MAKKNHPRQLPHVAGHGGYLFKRSRHLAAYDEDPGACLPTYPGPRQRPDSDHFTPENYFPPTDWPARGQLLRAPQVVWLSCQTLDDSSVEYVRQLAEKRYETWHLTAGSSAYLTGEFSPVSDLLVVLYAEYATKTDVWGSGSITSDGSYNYSYIDDSTSTYVYAHDGTDGTGISYDLVSLGPSIAVAHSSGTIKDGLGGHDWWIDTRIPNPFKEIYDRMQFDVFTEVKSRVEAMRPGRTWVDIIDWVDEYAEPPNNYWNLDGQAYDPTYWPMVASRIDDYYGTDFLHIYLGQARQIDGTPFEGDTTETVYVENKGVVGAAFDRYAGYRVLMYGLDPDYDAFAPADDFPFIVGSPTGPSIRRANGPTYVFDMGGGHHSDPLPFNDTIPFAELWHEDSPTVLAANMADATSTVSVFNSASVDYVTARESDRDDANTNARVMADDLADLGYSWEGDGKDLTADLLVAAIAAHFRFDPSTGIDLA